VKFDSPVEKIVVVHAGSCSTVAHVLSPLRNVEVFLVPLVPNLSTGTVPVVIVLAFTVPTVDEKLAEVASFAVCERDDDSANEAVKA
jgi:hypothetical protein